VSKAPEQRILELEQQVRLLEKQKKAGTQVMKHFLLKNIAKVLVLPVIYLG